MFQKDNVLKYSAFSGSGFDFARVSKTAYETLLILVYLLNHGLKEKKRKKKSLKAAPVLPDVSFAIHKEA